MFVFKTTESRTQIWPEKYIYTPFQEVNAPLRSVDVYSLNVIAFLMCFLCWFYDVVPRGISIFAIILIRMIESWLLNCIMSLLSLGCNLAVSSLCHFLALAWTGMWYVLVALLLVFLTMECNNYTLQTKP